MKISMAVVVGGTLALAALGGWLVGTLLAVVQLLGRVYP